MGDRGGSGHAVAGRPHVAARRGAVRIPDRLRRILGPRRSPAAKAAGPLGKGGARERPEFSPSGGNRGKRTLRRRRAGAGAPPWGAFRISPEGVGVIGGEAPYTTKGWRAGSEEFRLRAAYFLRAEKVGKDALRGVRARWVPRLRSAAAVTHRPRPPEDPHLRGTAPGRWHLRPARKTSRPFPSCTGLRPDPAEENPPALALRRLSGQN